MNDLITVFQFENWFKSGFYEKFLFREKLSKPAHTMQNMIS